jgi:hypothetical protein
MHPRTESFDLVGIIFGKHKHHAAPSLSACTSRRMDRANRTSRPSFQPDAFSTARSTSIFSGMVPVDATAWMARRALC